MQNSSRIFFSLLIIFLFSPFVFSQNLIRIKHFGKNKGHLKMFVHAPLKDDKQKSKPLIVVLHGCLQCASKVAKQTGWSKLADENEFYVLYPQQRFINNPEKCFKWYRRKHIYKNRGENSSIKKMIEYMQSNYSIDSKQVYITGLSAGAAMSVVMMADYPETFNAGAIYAGAPFKVATSMIPAAMAFLGWRIKTPEKWGNLVRKQNPDYQGEYPRMIIYQGNSDWIVNKRNGRELMKQWTNLLHISSEPTQTILHYLNIKDIERNIFCDANKNEKVIFYKVNKLSHALLVDPGKCQFQGGKRGFFSKDKNYFSTIWTARDFGILATPTITGKTVVLKNEVNVIFSVPSNSNCKYEWNFPSDCEVVKNEGISSISLNWGSSAGCVDVTEIDFNNCRKQFKTKFVSLESNK